MLTLVFASLIAACIGHLGLYVFIYNRINATGLPRLFLKLVDKALAISFVVTLGLVVYGCLSLLQNVFADAPSVVSQRPWGSLPSVVQIWIISHCGLAVGMGIPWLRNRPIFKRDRVSCEIKQTHYEAVDTLGHSPALSWRCRFQAKWPLNQILELSVDEKQLPIPDLPLALHGLKIAHLSDLHLTGDIGPEFHTLATDLAARWKPDVVFISGDIVDHAKCIEWLERILRPLSCPLGCYYVLGNHDRRVAEPAIIRREMRRWGWVDLAGHCLNQTWQDSPVELLGSEVPWFGANPSVHESSDAFRIFVSHSPDQISWARQHNVNLMLAGHTHGGQGRLPGIGPILSPSWYGSRFASGEFYLKPTTLHVSRGISGTHLARLFCPPEVSLLTLHRADS